MSDFNVDIYDLEYRLDHFGVYFGELIDYGSFDPEFMIVNFLLRDWNESRNNRHIIMNTLLKHCGITSGILPSGKKCTILNFVQFYYKPGEEIPDNISKNYTYRPNLNKQFKFMKEHIYESYFNKKRFFNQKYDQNSYSMNSEENGESPRQKS